MRELTQEQIEHVAGAGFVGYEPPPTPVYGKPVSYDGHKPPKHVHKHKEPHHHHHHHHKPMHKW